MNGILLVDKPQGWTSFDAVARVRSLARSSGVSKPKVGHTGTLDPLATGLLILLLGRYTKHASRLTTLDKTYEVVMRLGESSTTGDEEGNKTHVSDKRPSQQAIDSALQKFTGKQMQTPPIYSAIKINGQRAYKLAREGKAVELEARPIVIYETKLTAYEYPLVRFTCTVSSGTYIRSLVEDLGKDLTTGAYMTDLRRTRVGQFDIKDAKLIDQLTVETICHGLIIDKSSVGS